MGTYNVDNSKRRVRLTSMTSSKWFLSNNITIWLRKRRRHVGMNTDKKNNFHNNTRFLLNPGGTNCYSLYKMLWQLRWPKINYICWVDCNKFLIYKHFHYALLYVKWIPHHVIMAYPVHCNLSLMRENILIPLKKSCISKICPVIQFKSKFVIVNV